MALNRGTGVVLGKFDPPHRGHALLVDVARAHVDRTIALMWDYEAQSVPAATRAAWMREIFPDLDVRIVHDNPSLVDPETWARHALEILGNPPDTVFSSEFYGEVLARLMGARHFNVDRDRESVPCAGTMIRRAPLAHLAWLAPVVRAHYVCRVCVVGAESTGKTSLCENLAKAFQTSWVPEYGREYTIVKQRHGLLGKWRSDEFVHIALEQQRREDEAARTANRVLFCDTDSLATRVWHKRYLDFEPTQWPLPPSRIALYIVPYPDVPFVPDEIRDSEDRRFWMYERFVEEAQRAGSPYLVLRGDWDERFAAAVAAVSELLPESADR